MSADRAKSLGQIEVQFFHIENIRKKPIGEDVVRNFPSKTAQKATSKKIASANALSHLVRYVLR